MRKPFNKKIDTKVWGQLKASQVKTAGGPRWKVLHTIKLFGKHYLIARFENNL